jgi:nitrite reductase/ring-hydroxylating ferredoxin subunit
MPRYFTVVDEEAFGPGKVRRVRARDRWVAVFNDRGTLRAVDDACTCSGGSISEGSCDEGVVTCPWHGGQFRLSDGCGLGPPAYRRLQVYPIRVVRGVIEGEVEES